MATIDPYRQRTSRPTNSSPTQGAVSTQVTNAAAAGVASLGQRAEQIMAPRLEREAKSQALHDFAAQGLGKDENGNYVMPETPKGGQIYKEAFEQAARQRFVLETTNDAEAKLNDLYTDPDNFDRDPEELRQEATSYVRGLIAASPPEVQAELFNQLTREVRQRDFAASNKHLDRTIKESIAVGQATIDKTEAAMLDLKRIGGDEANAEFAALEMDLYNHYEALRRYSNLDDEAYTQMVDERIADLGNLRALAIDFEESYQGMTINEMMELSFALDNAGSEGGLGRTQQELLDQIKDPGLRAEFAKEIRTRARAEAARRDALAKAAEDEIDFSIAASGQGHMTDPKWAKMWRALGDELGVDPNTPEGFMALMTATGGSSPAIKHYKDVFNRAGKTSNVAEIKQLAELHDFFKEGINPVTGMTYGVEVPIDDKARVMMYHVKLALENGDEPDQAYETARTFWEEGLGVDSSEMRQRLYEAAGIGAQSRNKTQQLDGLLNDMFGFFDTEFNEQSFELRERILHSVAQNVVMGMDFEDAVDEAGDDFRARYTQDPYTSKYSASSWTDSALGALGRESNVLTWVPKEEAIPTTYDFQSQTQSRRWVEELGPIVAEMAGDQTLQRAGMKPIKDMRVGEDLKFVYSGMDGIFYAAYNGEQSQGKDVFIKDKDGAPLMLNIGRAAQFRSTGAAVIQNELHGRQVEARKANRWSSNAGIVSNWKSNNPKDIDRAGDMAMGNVVRGTLGIGDTTVTQDEDVIASAEARVRPMADWLRVERSVPLTGGDIQVRTYLNKARQVESKGDDNAKNKRSSATGRYQFTDATWLRFYRETFPGSGLSDSAILAKRKDGNIQQKVMENFTAYNASELRKAKLPITHVTLYGMHFLGDAAGIEVWKRDPSTSISNIVSDKALIANPGVLSFGGDPNRPKTVGFVRQWLAEKMLQP